MRAACMGQLQDLRGGSQVGTPLRDRGVRRHVPVQAASLFLRANLVRRRVSGSSLDQPAEVGVEPRRVLLLDEPTPLVSQAGHVIGQP
jgi:hypothetical protein